jgi:polyisoprenoid-binding protein YceI
MVHTFRAGLAAAVGHDLVLETTGWSADVTVADDDTISVDATIDLGTLVVRKGSGGAKPLTDRDRREIAHTARGLLDTDHHKATFTSTAVTRGDQGGTIDGTLSVRGTSNPFTLHVTESAPGHYTGTGTVLQHAYGIKPYTAFFGALKLADRVEIEIDVDLSGVEPAG